MTLPEYGGNVTFAQIERLAEAFSTRKIDLGIDRGVSSDPSVAPYIVVREAAIP